MKRFGVVAVLAGFASCTPVEGTPRTLAPINSCSVSACENYASTNNTKPACTEGRCETGSLPSDFKYVFVVSLPTTSFFGAGTTFAITSDEVANPAKQLVGCSPTEPCIALPSLVDYVAEYRVARNAAVAVGSDFGDGVFALPGQVTLRPMITGLDGTDLLASSVGFPLPAGVGNTGLLTVNNAAVTIRFTALLPPGKYQRILSVAPAFQSAFPPLVSEIRATGTKLEDVNVLGESPTELDDPTGTSRLATLRRAGGLDDFRVWLEDEKSGDKLSPVRTLSGEEAKVRLDTVGANDENSVALRNGVAIVLAPPESAVAMPRLVNGLIQGAGLVQEYPRLPAPVAVSGSVVGGSAATKIVFESTSINRLGAEPSLFLTYTTETYTDANGAFSTVLPPGIYDVRTVPGPSDSFALTPTAVVIGETATKLEPIEPIARTTVIGTAVLGDGRPLAAAEVIAIPSTRGSRRPWTLPRTQRTQTREDGAFSMSLDQGSFDVVIVPAAGSGFPIVVSANRSVFPASEDLDLGAFKVPAPVHLRYTVKDPNANVIARALVRAYTVGTETVPPVEIGRAMTDTSGVFDMFLSPGGL